MQHEIGGVDYVQLLDDIVSSLADTLQGINSRIKTLEDSSGLSILDEIDLTKNYKHGQLARSAGGLFQYDAKADGGDGAWQCLVNSVASVGVEETPEGFKIVTTKSNGDTHQGFFTLPKAPGRKTTKPVALAA